MKTIHLIGMVLIVMICGCETPQMYSPVVIKRVHHQASAIDKIVWVNGRPVKSYTVDPMQRYIVIAGVTYDGKPGTNTVSLSQNMYDCATVGDVWFGPQYRDSIW